MIANVPFLIHKQVDSFHTYIKSQDEIIKVQSQTHTVRSGYLLIEFSKLELATWLFCIIAERPDITCIYEERTLQFPE